MAIKDYKIIRELSKERLEEEVVKHIKKGWVVHGSMCLDRILGNAIPDEDGWYEYTSRLEFYQPMTYEVL